MALESKTTQTIVYRKDHNITCPFCKAKISLRNLPKPDERPKFFPYPHLILHGSPKHGLLIYLDADGKVRATEVIQFISTH